MTYRTYARPSWKVADLGTMYKRTLPPRFLMTESDVDRCVGEGETCLFRGGLVGAAVKLNCCPGSKCVFYGNSFSCVANSEIEVEKEMTDEHELENGSR